MAIKDLRSLIRCDLPLEGWPLGTIFGSHFILERHRAECSCSFCVDSPPFGKAMHLGVNPSECKAWNAWITVHWRWRGARWYLRISRGRLFSARGKKGPRIAA